MGLCAGREPWRQKLISSEAQSNIIFLLLEREWKNCWYQLPPWCWCLENAVGRARADVSPWQLLSRAPAEPFWKWMSFQRNLSRQIGFLSAVSNFIKMGAGCKMWLQVWPFVSLEVSNKVKFYLITCRFFMAFLCFHPGPCRSPFLLSCSFRANYHGSLKQSFLNLSFWVTFSKPLLCHWYQHLQKETASLFPSAASPVLHMLL